MHLQIDKVMAAEPSNNRKDNSSVTLNERSEKERLIENVYRPDIEKLHLFTQMLRVNSLFKKAKVVHK
ncbi:hypothetical protein ACQ86N_18540 [Puia sp. P3]|uniref:hypothetical protein n=1 Tax=Puia sp. P3 TaxID=3423952 RepID=UPI003D67FB26